jgi:hypothetical protein
MLLYCTPDALPHAKLLKQLSEKHGMKRTITLAPMRPTDILAALDGIKTGDFVLCVGNGLKQKLAAASLLRGTPAVQALGVCLVSRTPVQLAAAGLAGKCLGMGKPESALAQTTERALPESLRGTVSRNTTHRDNRSDALVRLVRLDTLDAAFVWDTPPPAPDLTTLLLPRKLASCPLNLMALSCSKLRTVEQQALLRLWQSREMADALSGGGTE